MTNGSADPGLEAGVSSWVWPEFVSETEDAVELVDL